MRSSELDHVEQYDGRDVFGWADCDR